MTCTHTLLHFMLVLFDITFWKQSDKISENLLSKVDAEVNTFKISKKIVDEAGNVQEEMCIFHRTRWHSAHTSYLSFLYTSYSYSNVFKYIQMYSNVFKCIQMYSNVLKYYWIGDVHFAYSIAQGDTCASPQPPFKYTQGRHLKRLKLLNFLLAERTSR